MKKKMNEVKGLLLSDKQMKDLKGGVATIVCPSGCGRSKAQCVTNKGICECTVDGLTMEC